MDDSFVGRGVHALARYVAIAGGGVLIAVTVVTVVSIAGRMLLPLNPILGTDFGPIAGDYEIVQAGMLFAIFSFLPWCHLTRGNAIVAILTDRFPVRFNALAEFVWDIVMLVTAVFIAWRLWAGMLDKIEFRESTFILRLPIWMSYATGMVGAVIFVVVAAYCLVRSGRNALSRAPQRPASEIAE